MNLDRINEHYLGDLADPGTERARQRIHWICSQATGKDVLDIGCSQGITCLILAREGFHCTGVDIEPDSLAVAREALANEDEIIRKRVTFQIADASELPYENGSFDTVILGEVIEHLTQPARALKEANRVLRDGGILIITVPFGLNAFHDHKQTFYPISFLELLKPFVRTHVIGTMANYITFVGVKDPAYDPASVPADAILGEYVRLATELEAHALRQERSLLETRARYTKQLKSQTTRTTEQEAQIEQLQETLQEKEKEVRKLGSDIDQQRATMAALDEKCRSLEAQSERHPDRWKIQQETLAKKSKQISELKTDLKKTHASFEKLRGIAEQRELELTGLRAESARLHLELSTSKQQIQTIRAQNQRLAAQIVSKDEQWSARLLRVEKLHSARLRSKQKQLEGLTAQFASERNRKTIIEGVRELARNFLPSGARVLVISKGDDELLQLDGRFGFHFPQGPGGVYAGYHPACSRDAIAHLETLRPQGVQYLMIPSPSLWWLSFYAEFSEHLLRNYRIAAYQENVALIFKLDPIENDGIQFQIRCPSLKSAKSQPVRALGNGTQVADTENTPATPQTSCGVRNGSPASRDPGSLADEANGMPVGGILDTFTAECFRPECRLISFTPDDWKATLEADKPQMLFVESAWRGNGGTWRNRIGKDDKHETDELAALVAWCQERNIPSIFWNKEDPVHFDHFLHRAAIFDYVFTSDADSVDGYRKHLGHDRVFPLPFAAQPTIHHPVSDSDRDGSVCFAGTYYQRQHEDRRNDMDFLLKPALDFGLEIYDRNYGLPGINPETYRFPDIYQPCIKGRLDYDEMVTAYKRYRVFLNVNTVKNSPTMFARRVFELLASGTPVISNYSKGIVDLLGTDAVFISESEQDTRDHLQRLLQDEWAWLRASALGIRKVVEEHTYHHRFRFILDRTGSELIERKPKRFTALAKVSSGAELSIISRTLSHQSVRPDRLLLLTEQPLEARELQHVANQLQQLKIAQQPYSSEDTWTELLKPCVQDLEYIALFDSRDYYGANYLRDYNVAVACSSANILGKCNSLRAHVENSSSCDTDDIQCYRKVDRVPTGSLVWKRGSISQAQLNRGLETGEFRCDPAGVLAIDPFNYAVHTRDQSNAAETQVDASLAQLLAL